MWGRRTRVAVRQFRRASTGGRLVYAVGDVHGRADLMRGLIQAITEDARETAAPERPLLVMLGDYIDRGADSRGVIDLILALRSADMFEIRCLKGNHEQALLEFMRRPDIGASWLVHGGRPTLSSYGVASNAATTEDWTRVRDALAIALPPEHLAFFSTLELSITLGDYLFVHAGVRPGVPLDAQSERDLLWIRADFLGGTSLFDKVVVHGHTPAEAPLGDGRRIGVDTGAYATGILTAARLCGEEQSFIQHQRC